MKIAYRARDIAEAHIVAGMLYSQGIEPHVGGHYLQGAMGEIGTSDYANVHVQDEDYERARVLVLEYEKGHLPGPEPDELDQPVGASPDVNREQGRTPLSLFTQDRIWLLGVAMVALLLMALL